MASPASSPALSGGPNSPEPLTPRSKIRALLATVESSDDEDGVETANMTGCKLPTRTSTNRTLQGKEVGTRGDEESDESDVAMRPRGKLASRMQGAIVTGEEPENISAAPDSARERVKKMLDREEASVRAAQSRHGDTEDEDEDNDLPIAPRRLNRRAPRGPTPENREALARSPSPGLFVSSPTRPSPAKSHDDNPDSDDDLPAIKSDRFKALVERKRQERLAREAAEEARKAEQRARQEKLMADVQELESDDSNDSGITDDEGGRRLTQEARPTRKASKRVIEEMNRETQRMARNMQLAHEAKTRKKISKASLFERFNYRPPGLQPEPKTNSSSPPNTPKTDSETKNADTPPSSPPAAKEGRGLPPVQHNAIDVEMYDSGDEGLPSLDDVMKTAAQQPHKGKGKALAIDLDDDTVTAAQKPTRRVRVRLPVVAANMLTLDSDDELEIVRTTKDKINALFDSIPANRSREPRPLQTLRALAQVKSPAKEGRNKDGQSCMTAGELQAQLHQRARQQAKLERERRLETLKAQGVVIQTADERERQQQEVERLVAKAREEAQKIMQQERAAAKMERKESGEADPLAWDDSEDEEYENSASDAGSEASAIELSGSEDEEGVGEEEEEEVGDEEEEEEGEGDDDDGEGGVNQGATSALFDENAESGESEDDENLNREEKQKHDQGDIEADDEGDDELPVTKHRRARKHAAILSDDEAEVEATPRPTMATAYMTPAAPRTVSPALMTSVLRSARKTFIPGLPVQGPAGLGLTQIFAGTMDDSQTSSAGGPTQSMMPDFDHFPDSNFSATAGELAEDVVMDSQMEETLRATQDVRLSLSQSQLHGLDSLLPDGFNTQMSEAMEPSQDCGLQKHTPIRNRFTEPPLSTVETIPADQPDDDVAHESPLARRGRRLRRKMEMPVVEEEESTQATVENAFNVMADGAKNEKRKRFIDDFNRKKSKAKEMVEEQAEESEDEYAGLGGADGEESDNESTGSLQEIIDDAAGNDVDEAKLAAFYADRERANDEKEVEKLFKDITTGMLRRKRGADYDLSDSDDDGEARRRMKRRQFAKMQKALFQDERIKKVAEDPGNQAFLRTIEDRGSDDEMDLLDVADAPEQADSQSQSEEAGSDAEEGQRQQTIPDSQPSGRRPLGVSDPNVAPAHTKRRTKGGKKASYIGDVRETLSDLLDERQPSVIPATQIDSDSEEEEDGRLASPRSDKENQAPGARGDSLTIVDRISLKREASSASSSSSTRFAFVAQASAWSFKVPALLRRATTNSTLMSGSTGSAVSATGVTTGNAGGFAEDAKIKRGAGKKSGVNGFARAAEPKPAMRESERRREQKKARTAERSIGLVGGLLSKGSFK